MSQAGIINVIESNPAIPIYFDTDSGFATALFNVIRIVGAGGVTTSATNNVITITGSGGGGIQTITGTDGVAIPPISGNFTFKTSYTNATFARTAGTLTLDFSQGNNNYIGTNLTSLTTGAFNTIFGEDSGQNISSGSSNTIIGGLAGRLINIGNFNLCLGMNAGENSTGSSSYNIYLDNSGLSSESYTIRLGNFYHTRAFLSGVQGVAVASSAPVSIDANGQLSTLGYGVAGRVLTSTGPASSPTWQPIPATTFPTVTGNTGGAQSVTTNYTFQTANSTVVFAGTAGPVQTLNFGIPNLIFGSSPSITSGSQNTGFGYFSFSSITTGSLNCAYGAGSGNALSGGGNNSFYGANAGQFLTSGSINLFLGYNSGTQCTSSESNNILLANIGVTGENNVTRIGTAGTHNKAYISGITAVTVAASAPVAIDTNGQLSSLGFGTVGQILTSNGAATSPSWTAPSYVPLPWTDQASSFSALANNGYFVTATAVATLPAAPTQGQRISFAVDSAAGILTIQATAGKVIRIGKTASAAAGTAVSTLNGDSITLVYRASDTTWIATQCIGSFDVT